MDPMMIQQLVQQAQMQGAPAGMAPPAGAAPGMPGAPGAGAQDPLAQMMQAMGAVQVPEDPKSPVAQTTFPAQQSAMNPQYMQMMISLLNQKANGAPGLGQILGG